MMRLAKHFFKFPVPQLPGDNLVLSKHALSARERVIVRRVPKAEEVKESYIVKQT